VQSLSHSTVLSTVFGKYPIKAPITILGTHCDSGVSLEKFCPFRWFRVLHAYCAPECCSVSVASTLKTFPPRALVLATHQHLLQRKRFSRSDLP
jgi:hypothetical protein